MPKFNANLSMMYNEVGFGSGVTRVYPRISLHRNLLCWEFYRERSHAEI